MLRYLSSTRQEDKAGDLLAKQGQHARAVSLYLSGGYAGKAAALLVQCSMLDDGTLCERVLDMLVRQQLFEAAGLFLEKRGLHERALQAYQRGNEHVHAIRVAKLYCPGEVVKLEAQCADYMMKQRL